MQISHEHIKAMLNFHIKAKLNFINNKKKS